MNTNSKKKYRASLSAEQIAYILNAIRADIVANSNIATDSIKHDTLKVFTVLNAKVSADILTPAYIVEESNKNLSKPIEETLGIDASISIPSTTVPTYVREGFTSKEAFWYASYQKYRDEPTLCSEHEVLAAKEYMYLNDLMSPEEAKEHEKSIG